MIEASFRTSSDFVEGWRVLCVIISIAVGILIAGDGVLPRRAIKRSLASCTKALLEQQTYTVGIRL